MIDKRMRQALGFRLDEGEKARLWQQIQRAAEQTPPETEEKNMKKSTRTIVHIALIAAVLATLFTVAASASGFLGVRAIVLPQESSPAAVETAEPEKAEEPGGAAEPEKAEEPGGAAEPEESVTLASITQPQAVPEELDPAIAARVENARAAWQEWMDWKQARTPQDPPVFTPPKDAGFIDYEVADDGSATIRYYSREAVEQSVNTYGELRPDALGEPMEVRSASREEMAAHQTWMDYANGISAYGDYDFNYRVSSAEDAEKLEEIAAGYGLSLRRGTTLLWSKETTEESDAEMNARYGTNFHTDTSDARFLSNAELCERVQTVLCHAPLFSRTPAGFDKVYYFDEGSFCISYYVNLSSGERVSVYGYNSVYSSLSSGREVVSRIEDPEAFTVRTHTAPDGTELTILRNGGQIFLYAYLDQSFFEEEIHGTPEMSDTEVDAIADFLNYSSIGREASAAD